MCEVMRFGEDNEQSNELLELGPKCERNDRLPDNLREHVWDDIEHHCETP